VDLNKISVKQEGGQMIPQQPGMSNQPQVDPMVQQITEMISSSVNEGRDLIDVVTELSQQEVDQQLISQALMMGGMKEEDIFVVFEQVQERMQPPGPSSSDEVNQNPQLLARNESMEEPSPDNFLQGAQVDVMGKSGIEIKKANRGKFTAWAKARGMGVQEAAIKVMANKDQYPPSVVKMANFAKNAAKFKKQEGGESFPDLTGDGKVTQADILKGRGVEMPKYQMAGETIYKYDDYYQQEDGSVVNEDLPEVDLGTIDNRSTLKKFTDGIGNIIFNQEGDTGYQKYIKQTHNPLYQLDNTLQLLQIPSNLVRESLEGLGATYEGDGEFNAGNILPDFFGTTLFDDDAAQVPISRTMGVDGFLPSLFVDMVFDPTTYIGAGVLKNIVQKFGKKTAEKVLPKLVNKATTNINKLENVVPRANLSDIEFNNKTFKDLQQDFDTNTLSNKDNNLNLVPETDDYFKAVDEFEDSDLQNYIDRVDFDFYKNQSARPTDKDLPIEVVDRIIGTRGGNTTNDWLGNKQTRVQLIDELLGRSDIPVDMKSNLIDLDYMNDPTKRREMMDYLQSIGIDNTVMQTGGQTPQMYTGGNVPIGFNPDPNVQAELEKGFGFMAGMDLENPKATPYINSGRTTAGGGFNVSGYDKRALLTAPFSNPIGELLGAGLKVYDDLFDSNGVFTNRDEKREMERNPLNVASYYDFEYNLDDSEENVNALTNYYRQRKREADERKYGFDQNDAYDAINNSSTYNPDNDPNIAKRGGPTSLPKAQFGTPQFNPRTDDFGQYIKDLSTMNNDGNNTVPGGSEAQRDERAAFKAMMDQYSGMDPEVELNPNDIDLYSESDLEADELILGPDSNELKDLVDFGSFDITNKLEGTLNRIEDSQFMKEYAGISGGIYDLANAGNNVFDFYNKKKVEDDRDFNLMADNLFSTVTSDAGNKGNYKELSGMFRSNKDRVVGYDEFLQQPGMTFGREGGEQMPNNPGFNALPNSVQRKIVDNMKYGGPKGEDIYLSRKDAAIKASMAQAQDGTEMNYTEGMRQREGSYNPPNRKYTLDPRFRQGGGEVVDLSADMITELIAAGADIEIL
tara:strand:+ start:3590 stop:6826 length:3237 start_codon:yes stop_codon:yes gene_type:complete